MPRRPRIDLPGYYHLVNRGVARANVYLNNSDKDKFLEILCKACFDYKANVHDYCLMDNHYHLLIETKQDNLSLLMRQINCIMQNILIKSINELDTYGKADISLGMW